MRIKILTAMSILLIGVAACNNAKPADPAVTTPATEVTTPSADTAVATNAVETTMEPSNAITEPAATNEVAAPTDEPRANEDRRIATPADGAAEPK
jgi:hypothetical protein